VIETLRLKHPSQAAPLPIVLPVDANRPVASTTKEVVEKRMKSFQKGSGCGPDGFRPDYFKDILSSPDSALVGRYIQAYTKYANDILSGKLPVEFQPFFSSARLIALNKADNGIRPIAVGNVDSRLISKLGCAFAMDDAQRYFSPLQIGVRVPGGANAAVHAINRIMEQFKEDNGMTVLTIDFANAFNNFKRDVLLGEIAAHLPSLLPLAQTKYISPPHLFLGDAILSSQSGVQQGDPLGPMFFALILQRLVRKIKDQCPDLSVNVWYLDDGTLIGKTEDVKRAFDIIQQECLLLGLELNSHKCELWWPNGDLGQWLDFPAEMKRNVGKGIKLLGIPVGYEHAPHVVNTRISKIEAILNAISDSALNAHCKIILIRSCAAMPKFMFALQSTPPVHILQCISRFDSIVSVALTSILGTALPPVVRARMALPIGMGGLGLPSAAETALPAYLGSMIQTMDLQAKILDTPVDDLLPQIETLLAALNISLANDTQLLLAPLRESKTPQLLISKAMNVAKLAKMDERMEAEGSHMQRRSFLASQLPLSGEWLKAFPIPGLNLVMPNRHYVLVLRAYFGLRLYEKSTQCPVCKNGLNDEDGVHASNCNPGGAYIRRHDAMKLTVAKIAREAGYSTETEPVNLLEDGTQDRPADVLIRMFNGMKDVAIDVNVTGTMREVGHPAIKLNSVAQTKRTKYTDRCNAVNIDFVPFIVDSIGGFHPDAVEVVKKLGNVWSANKNCTPAVGRSRVAQQISFQMKRVMGVEYAKRDPTPDLVEVVSLESG